MDAVHRAVRIDGGIALVAGDHVMEILPRICPVLLCYNDIALRALRPRRRFLRVLACGNAIGPIREHLQGALPAQRRELAVHV